MFDDMYLDLRGHPLLGVLGSDHRRQQHHGTTQGRSLHQRSLLRGCWVGQEELCSSGGRANAAGVWHAKHSFQTCGEQTEVWKR